MSDVLITTSVDAEIVDTVNKASKLYIVFHRVLSAAWSKELVELVHLISEVGEVSG